MTIAIDFDGTIVEHNFPYIGKPIPLAIETMKEWQSKGYKLILWTMRSYEYLEEALAYCEKNGIKFFGVNENPTQAVWTTSAKAFAHVYIDDLAVGVPTKNGVLDWEEIKKRVDIVAGRVKEEK